MKTSLVASFIASLIGCVLGIVFTLYFVNRATNRSAAETHSLLISLRQSFFAADKDRADRAYFNGTPEIAAWVLLEFATSVSNQTIEILGSERNRTFYLFVANARLAKAKDAVRDPSSTR